MAKVEVKELTNKRAQIKSKLTRFETFLLNFNAEDKTYYDIEVRLTVVQDLANKFDEIQGKLELLTGKEQENERDTFEDTFYNVTAKAQRMIDKLKSESATSNASERGNSIVGEINSTGNASIDSLFAKVKLPNINLPEFHGSYEGWNAFHDIFTTLVHKNSQLVDVQRFYYLQSCLKGDAAQLIQSMEISAANYPIAWALLNERFDNKKLIVNAHIKAIFELDFLKVESHVQLRKLLDNFNKHFRSLKALGLPTDTWDNLVIYLLCSKLDVKTKKEWEQSISKEKFENVKLKTLTDFLATHCQLLESIDSKAKTTQVKINEKSSVHVATTNKFAFTCSFCEKGHSNRDCDKFATRMTVQERYDSVKRNKLCFNCLRPGHFTNDCKSRPCAKCSRKHNVLLHDTVVTNVKQTNKVVTQIATNADSNLSLNNSTTCSCITASEPLETSMISYTGAKLSQVLLATATIKIQNADGEWTLCRALLDSGSQTNFITENMVNRLKLDTHNTTHLVTGISGSTRDINKQINLTIGSNYDSYKTNESFLVTRKITDDLPQIEFDMSKLKIPPHLKLADNKFHESKPIDALLGAKIFFDILCMENLRLGKNELVLQKTKLGWILSGNIFVNSRNNQKTTCNLTILNKDIDLNEQLKQFWTLEEVKITSKPYNREELECENDFVNNFSRDISGRFKLTLPLKNNYKDLGDSEQNARKRLLQMEKRFQRDKTFKDLYVNFMEEYIALGHMTKVDTTKDTPDLLKYFLPHHGILKDSVTTRLRVVFDASCKTTTGISLNDVLKVGPTIQNDLCTIALHFRKHNIVFVADIAKMYRQCDIVEEHRDLQRVLWRSNANDTIEQYKLNTVTYGTAPASFLACRCLEQLAKENETLFPEACRVIRNCFYMDDLIAGAKDVKSAKQLKCDITKILESGCFSLRKWCSNNRELLDNGDLGDLPEYYISDDDTVRTLGLVWRPKDDCLGFSVEATNGAVTKRIILSDVARIFDPLGLINPITVQGKLILQTLWLEGLNWDDPVNNDILNIWNQFRQSLNHLKDLQIPRQVVIPNYKSVEIHGFCDASERCYGACFYLRCKDLDGHYVTRLLCAKSKIAPCKKDLTTLPRLELNGALVLARVLEKVLQSMDLEHCTPLYLWSDSTIVLNWLKSDSRNWNTYVANRVAQIQALTSGANWRYVPSEINPADLLSRGCSPQNLINNNLWWNGPEFLKYNSEDWPKNLVSDINELPERKKPKGFTLTVLDNNFIFNLFSKFSTLQKTFTYVLRFIRNCRVKRDERETGALTVEQLENSLNVLLKIVQNQYFNDEFECLKRGKPLRKNSKLLCLNVFLDSNDLIRVGGRLRHSQEHFDKRHPILLPDKHKMTKLIIEAEHERYLHAGQQATLAAIRTKYWPINGRSVVRSIVRKCIKCFKARPNSAMPIMGDLPPTRVTPTRPFSCTGVDYAGPFMLKDGTTRSRKLVKAYVCVFVCFATKAVHLELAGDLSSTTFLNCLKRFVSRRGFCANIYSDNGRNFVGAAKELKILMREMQVDEKLKQFCLKNSMEWHFIPPFAPNQGGLWEAAVKSMKSHLIKTIGLQHLTFESMYTVLCQIEGVLNSRPLIPLSNDPEDLSYLTPSHFLIGDTLLALPQRDNLNIPINRLKLYQSLQHMFQHFWKRWSSDYLTTLQQRAKWRRHTPNIELNDLVLIKEDFSPPLSWLVGRVVELHPGPDNVVRVISVRTSKGIQRRSAARICKLPMVSSDVQ